MAIKSNESGGWVLVHWMQNHIVFIIYFNIQIYELRVLRRTYIKTVDTIELPMTIWPTTFTRTHLKVSSSSFSWCTNLPESAKSWRTDNIFNKIKWLPIKNDTAIHGPMITVISTQVLSTRCMVDQIKAMNYTAWPHAWDHLRRV